jgi:hypothetical protein
VCQPCVYAAQRWLCAGAIFADILFFEMDCQISVLDWEHGGFDSI